MIIPGQESGGENTGGSVIPTGGMAVLKTQLPNGGPNPGPP